MLELAALLGFEQPCKGITDAAQAAAFTQIACLAASFLCAMSHKTFQQFWRTWKGNDISSKKPKDESFLRQFSVQFTFINGGNTAVVIADCGLRVHHTACSIS